MSDQKSTEQQRNDKKHRKLIRSPENLSPCELDSAFNPSFLSSSTSIFPVQSNTRSSPTKNYNDQFPPHPHNQQFWSTNDVVQTASSSLPPSSSTPAIALYRKPSITIKYSKDEEHRSGQQQLQTSQAYQQQISKSIDSQISSDIVDQKSNNYHLINVNSVPGCCSQGSTKKQLEQSMFSSLFSFNGDTRSSKKSTARDIKQTQQQPIFAHSPTSQSLNLNLTNQSGDYSGGQIMFNSNNPFLNDTFDAITAHEDEGGGEVNTNFFNIDDDNESASLFVSEKATTVSKDCEEMEEQLLKNKREKFSNASTMKICLVVSPPTNKMFHLKSKSLNHLDRIQPQINISSTEKKINGEANATANSPHHEASSTIAHTAKFTTASNSNQNDTKATNDSTNLSTTINSHADHSLSMISTQIKKKSSSFLHRDYNRKPILARSQVSSSEYFSVCFDTENGFKDKDEIFIAASKGIALGDSLRQAMIQRSLSFTQISVIDYGVNNSNELGIPQYFGPLEVNTDIGVLAGHCLLVTEKDNVQKKSGHYVLKKAASVGYRSTTSRLFTSASTEETVEDTTKTTKQTKQRWSLQLFGVKNPQQSQLCELLNHYMRNGVPKSKSSYVNSEYSDEALDALYGLPQSWRDFVNACDISETDTKIQSAIWELVTTEVDYIHAIQTVTDLFLSCLEGIQSENLLKDIDQHKLFSNIRDICDANLKLWSIYLYPMVKHSMLTGHLMCIDYFQQGFTNFATIFEPYTKYCAEQVLCQNYCKDLNRNNALFTAYLAWCESQKECNRLRLADILVRPMQRLTKYNLLLSAVRKHISEDTESEIMDAMIAFVDDFVCSVNSHLTTRQENERLKGIMARIESYDVVDSNNESLEKLIKQYSQMFDLSSPMKGCVLNQCRYLFLEGDMKYKDSISKMDVHCFLLTDILLICKQTAKKGHGNLKVIRPFFMTDRLVVKLKEKDNVLHCVYLNDFNMVTAAFVLQCNEAKNWHDGFNKARHIYTKLKQDVKALQPQLQQQPHGVANSFNVPDSNSISIKKSPLGSSIVSSLNNSHSGSVELNESKAMSVDFEKTNSISSDEGSYNMHSKSAIANNRKLRQTSSNSLTVQSYSQHLNQSMPNLTSGPYHANSNNTLLVPGASKSHSAHSSHSGNLLSPSQRGISYPPPSPTRATLRRGFAFSTSINNKNPPLIKSRNVTSLSWAHQQSIAAAAAAASVNVQHQPSHIQVVYDPRQGADKDSINKLETNASDT